MTTRMLIATLCTLLATQAWADRPYFGDTLTFRLGGMEQKADVTFSSTRNDRPTYKLDFSDLGLDDKASTVYAGVSWQFFDSWGIDVSYSSFDSNGSETATESGNFGDIEWDANATLKSNYDLDLYIIDLHWDFINTGQTHAGLGLGLHIADINTGIDFTLTGTVNGQPVILDSGSETVAVTAPLPDIVVRAGHQFGDNFYLGFTGGWFSLKYKDIDGELLSARANFEWRPVKHFGVGVGYQYVSVQVTEDDGNKKNRLDNDMYGPILYVTAGL